MAIIFWPFPLRVFVVYVGVLWPRSSVRHLIGPFFAPTAATARVRTAVSVILNEPPFWVEPCGSIAVTRMAAHMGMFAVKGQVYGFMGSSPVVVSNPRFEPVSMT